MLESTVGALFKTCQGFFQQDEARCHKATVKWLVKEIMLKTSSPNGCGLLTAETSLPLKMGGLSCRTRSMKLTRHLPLLRLKENPEGHMVQDWL